MTETIKVTADCPECPYSFEKEITDSQIQTALSDYSDTQEAVQHFCGGELPIPPSVVFDFLGLVAAYITIKNELKEKHNVSSSKGNIKETCPNCGSSKYEIETEQK